MESIDCLARAINEFAGGLVLVSHDMRLISQVGALGFHGAPRTRCQRDPNPR